MQEIAKRARGRPRKYKTALERAEAKRERSKERYYATRTPREQKSPEQIAEANRQRANDWYARNKNDPALILRRRENARTQYQKQREELKAELEEMK